MTMLRKIHSAQGSYQATLGDGEYGTLEQLVGAVGQSGIRQRHPTVTGSR